jgi:3-dehydroquinate dehydratase
LRHVQSNSEGALVETVHGDSPTSSH